MTEKIIILKVWIFGAHPDMSTVFFVTINKYINKRKNEEPTTIKVERSGSSIIEMKLTCFRFISSKTFYFHCSNELVIFFYNEHFHISKERQKMFVFFNFRNSEFEKLWAFWRFWKYWIFLIFWITWKEMEAKNA